MSLCDCAVWARDMRGEAGEPESGLTEGAHISYIQIPSLHPGQQSTIHFCVAGKCHFVLRVHAIASSHTIRAQVAVNKADKHLAPIHGF